MTRHRTKRWPATALGSGGATGCATGPTADFGYRIVVGVVGLAVLGVGIVAIPYPGPGWAIVFVGLAILATEFDWARRLLSYASAALRQGDGLVPPAGC